MFSFKIMGNFRMNNVTEATRARNRRKKLGRELVRRMHEINRARRIELNVKRKNLVRLIRLSEDEIIRDYPEIQKVISNKKHSVSIEGNK